MLDIDLQNFRELISISSPVMVLAQKKGNLTSECHMTLPSTSRVFKPRLCLLIPTVPLGGISVPIWALTGAGITLSYSGWGLAVCWSNRSLKALPITHTHTHKRTHTHFVGSVWCCSWNSSHLSGCNPGCRALSEGFSKMPDLETLFLSCWSIFRLNKQQKCSSPIMWIQCYSNEVCLK